jgi:hypothetical protein
LRVRYKIQSDSELVIAARHRVRVDDVRRVRVRAYALSPDAYVRAYALFHPRRADARDAGRRVNAYAYAKLLRVDVRVRVRSLSLLLLLNVKIARECHYTPFVTVMAKTRFHAD